MKNIIIVAFLVLPILLTGCSNLRRTAADKLTPVIADHLECSSQAAIKADLLRWMGANEDDTVIQPKSLAGDACKMGVAVVLDLAAKHAIPKRWECRAEKLPADLKEKLAPVCDSL